MEHELSNCPWQFVIDGKSGVKKNAKHGKPNLQEGRIVRASFLMKYESGGRPRKLELRPPNVAILDRDRDGAVAEAFMAANDLLKADLDG